MHMQSIHALPASPNVYLGVSRAVKTIHATTICRHPDAASRIKHQESQPKKPQILSLQGL